MNKQVRLSDLLGSELEEKFEYFDLTEIQDLLSQLQLTDVIDLAHAEFLQQKALRGADILTEYLGKIVKTVGYLESKLNRVRNAVSLEYKAPDGSRTTTDMKIWAGAASPEVEQISILLSKAKASKIVLEKKYELLIRSHHHYKDIASGLRKSILPNYIGKVPEGYE
jgi:hypothetical protein